MASLKDLSERDKRMIIHTGKGLTILSQIMANHLKVTPETVMEIVSKKVFEKMSQLSSDDVDREIEAIQEARKNNKNTYVAVKNNGR